MSDRLHQILLAARPQGAPRLSDFEHAQGPLPALSGEGQVLLHTRWLSLDPYMRMRMNDARGYADPTPLGGVMPGGTVARVLASTHEGFAAGDLVAAYSGWQSHAVSDGRDLVKLPAHMPQPSLALGVLGMPGYTAWHGLLTLGQPQAGETVVVAAATGAVGSVVGQIAKFKGCRAIGIAGGADKCRYAVEHLGFDACIDHHAGDFRAQLAAACPKGIDVYFENVGGAVFAAVRPLLNLHARIPLCGLIADYNRTAAPEGPDRLPGWSSEVLAKRLRVQGFIISDHYGPGGAHEAFLREMSSWVFAGQVRMREDVVDGLGAAPQAFIGLLEGRNFGKLLVRVSAD